MKDQKYYDRMPDVLPKTLPAGTRTTSKLTALSEVRFDGRFYIGEWNQGDFTGGMFPGSIRWTSVPIVDATPECACCGAPACRTQPLFVADENQDASQKPSCLECWPLSPTTFADGVRARRTLSSAPVGTGNAQSSGAGEALTKKTFRERLEEIRASRSIDDGPEPAPLHVGADNGPPANLCSTPACAARGVVATNGEWCVYCANIDNDRCQTLDDGDPVVSARNAAAHARLDRWDAAERPRPTATSKLLAMGHPSSWPEIGEDEP